MIVLKLELHSAVTGRITTLGQAIIANDGAASRQNPKRGSYDCYVANKSAIKDDDDPVGHWLVNGVLRRGRVENYPRLSYNVWRLVIRALLSAFPEEKAGG